MATNSIEISRELVHEGMDKKIADAVAAAIVKHYDENFATKAGIAGLKADIARLEGKIESLEIKINIILGLLIGAYIGFIVKFL